MKLEARHIKVIKQCNYDTFITVTNKKGSTQQKAINELYKANKILIGHWTGGGLSQKVAIKLSKRIKNYNKAII